MHNALKISPPPSSLLFFTVGDVIFHQFFSCPATGSDLSLCISVMAGGDNNTVGNIRHGSLGVRYVKGWDWGVRTRKLLIRFAMSEQSEGWLMKQCVCGCAHARTRIRRTCRTARVLRQILCAHTLCRKGVHGCECKPHVSLTRGSQLSTG